MKSGKLRTARTVAVAALLLVIALALTGCGEQKKYEQAARALVKAEYFIALSPNIFPSRTFISVRWAVKQKA